MKKRILATLSLVGLLSVFALPYKAEAAWKTTSKGTQYTIEESPGYLVGLKKVDGNTYYFNKQGYMLNGWFKTGGRTFYFDPATGAMKTGRVVINGKAYYFSTKNGVLQTGWFQIPGSTQWYYSDATGVIQSNKWIDGYYVDSTGKRASGFLTIGQNRYFFVNGKYQVGWFSYNGTKYYANGKGVLQKDKWLGRFYVKSDSSMALGWTKIGSKKYYFNPSNGVIVKNSFVTTNGYRFCTDSTGAMITSKWIHNTYYVMNNGVVATGWRTVNGQKYYFHSTTGAKVKGFIKYNGKTYYTDKTTGVLVTSQWVGEKYVNRYGVVVMNNWYLNYYFDENGDKVSGWQTINGNRFYFDPADSQMVTGLQTIGGSKYYFRPTAETSYPKGSLVTSSTVTVNGKIYTIDASGVVISEDVATLGKEIAEYALKFKGYPYVYGGNNLYTGVDCSGFTQQVMLHFGIKIPRTADQQMKGNGTAIDLNLNELLPGDLIFYGSTSYSGHVALYIGDGKIIHAADETLGIIVSKYNYRQPVKAMRYW
ncbi:MAG: NlpC/P60 family protein [Lachnospiraceae bacterium]|nr:NlpC/P60 family protein [Robinsoniella sp.]MDY3765952.1 NlpC/P60 family protein [Lachnospiraceae bacterium]